MHSSSSVGNQEMTYSRTFAAPRQKVWDAWTTPEGLSSWFGTPPFTTPLSTVSMDVRTGGAWSATMVHESDPSQRMPFAGTYQEVTPPEKLVMLFQDTTNPENPLVETLTITFQEIDGETMVTINQAGHLPQEQYPKLVEGYTGFMHRLEEYLNK